MPYLVPPMDPEPPPDYVEFVAGRLVTLAAEAARLVGGPAHADEVYPEALSDVAGRWRLLRLLRRLGRRHAIDDYLGRRLTVRAKQWRDEQIYPVDVRPVRAPATRLAAVFGPAGGYGPAASLALRKAPLLPATARGHNRPVAEAAIAWSHAYSRYRWRRLARTVVAAALLLGAMYQAVSIPPTP
jgi:hypothetical protein